MPTVSIILPTYKNPTLLNRAIESILPQSFVDWELIVVDDGLTNEARKNLQNVIEKDSRIRVVTNSSNMGIQKSLNAGIKAAQGTYIARIDDDDAWIDSNKLASQIKFLHDNPSCVLVGTGTVVVDASGKELFRYVSPQNDTEIRSQMLYKNCFTHSSVVFKKSAALEVGGYSESKEVLHIEDYDLWLKLGILGELHTMQTYSVAFMQHAGSISAQNKIAQLKRNAALIRRNRNVYPNYLLYAIIAELKIIGYPVFAILPGWLKRFISRSYKN